MSRVSSHSTAPARIPGAAIGKMQGQLSCSPALQTACLLPSQSIWSFLPTLASFPTLTPLELAHSHLCHQGQLHWVAQVRCRASSPNRSRWQGERGGGHYLHTHTTSRQMSSRVSFPTLSPSGLAHLCPHYQGWLCCAVQSGCRVHFPKRCSW